MKPRTLGLILIVAAVAWGAFAIGVEYGIRKVNEPPEVLHVCGGPGDPCEWAHRWEVSMEAGRCVEREYLNGALVAEQTCPRVEVKDVSIHEPGPSKCAGLTPPDAPSGVRVEP